MIGRLPLLSSLHRPLVVNLRGTDVFHTSAARDVFSRLTLGCCVFVCGSTARLDALLASVSTCDLRGDTIRAVEGCD
jgi:hypothetical protein